MYERGIILRISPVHVYSQANSFQARVENRHYKEKNCDIYQELKDDFLVYERRELYHDNVRLTIVKEFFHVTVPLIGATIGTLLLLGTTVIFAYFLPPQLLLGGSADVVGGYTIAMYIVMNVKSAGTAQMAQGATIGVLCALIGTPIVFLSRNLIDKYLPAYEY